MYGRSCRTLHRYCHHWWRYAMNPWRECDDNEESCTAFYESYNDAPEKMIVDWAGGTIHFSGVLVNMLRHPA